MKKIEYAGTSYYVISETLNFYYVSEKKKGGVQTSIRKMDYLAYNTTKSIQGA